MGRANRSADVWARTYPGAYRLAFLLVGDRAAAGRVAERTFVRMHVRYRDFSGRGSLEFWTIRNVVRLCRMRSRTRVLRRLHPSPAARGGAPFIILDRLRFRRRAAYVLSVYGGMELGEVADALDCSSAGVSALLSAADQTMARGGLIPPGRSEFESLVADLPEPHLERATLRKAARARVTVSLAMAALTAVSIAAGSYALQMAEPEPPVEHARAIQVPGLRGASDARSDLARFGAPEWCPDLDGTRQVEGESHGAAADSAIRFDIALVKGSYQKTIRALLHPSPGAPARTRDWPHHRDATGLGVIQISEGSADPDLVRACGRDAAERTLKVAIWQQGANDGAGEVIAFYTVLSDGGWEVWASNGP